LGWARIAFASSRVIVNSCSSASSERESEPFLMYGPYRPFCAVTSSPSSCPRVRGRVSRRSASASVTVSSYIVLNSDAVF